MGRWGGFSLPQTPPLLYAVPSNIPISLHPEPAAWQMRWATFAHGWGWCLWDVGTGGVECDARGHENLHAQHLGCSNLIWVPQLRE